MLILVSSVVTFSLHALNDFPYTARLIHKSTTYTPRTQLELLSILSRLYLYQQTFI